MKLLKHRRTKKYTCKKIYNLLGIEESKDNTPPFLKKKKNISITDVNKNLINNTQKENADKNENNKYII